MGITKITSDNNGLRIYFRSNNQDYTAVFRQNLKVNGSKIDMLNSEGKTEWSV